MSEMIDKLELIVWVDDNQKQIELAQNKIRDRRLLDLMQVEGVKRAHDDLAKSFYRTLAELRKHQSWRRKNQEIDVTPDTDATETE